METIRELATLQQVLAELDEKLADMSVMQDFKDRMTMEEAASVLGVKSTVIKRAIERGEMPFIIIPGAARKTVTPCALRDWIQEYCIHRNAAIPA